MLIKILVIIIVMFIVSMYAILLHSWKQGEEKFLAIFSLCFPSFWN